MTFDHPKCAEGLRAILARAEQPMLRPVEARAFMQMENWLYAIQTGTLIVSEPEADAAPEPEKPARKTSEAK